MENPLPSRPRPITWVIAGLLVVAGLLQLVELRTRFIDPDEFEHLHAASMVARGEVPYRDFFEHHGPLLYYALQPLFWLFGQQLTVLWIGRGLMWLCSMAALGLTARQAARMGGSGCGLVAAALLAWTTIFHLKGIELRPDVPALLLIQLAITVLIEGKATFRSSLAAGLFGGLATLCTQKAIVPIAGLAVAATAREILGGSERRTFWPAAGLALGGAVVWGAAFAAFRLVGAASDLWHGTVVQLLNWPVRSQRWDHLRPTLAADFTVWFAGAVEIASSVRRLRNHDAWRSGRAVCAIVAAFSILSLFWVKATYPQFYLLWFPVLSMLAAVRIVYWCREPHSRTMPIAGLFFTAGLAATQGWLWHRAWKLDQTGALAALVESWRHLQPAGRFVVPGALLFLAATTIWLLIQRRWIFSIALLCTLGMFHAVLRNIDAALRTNGEQVRRVEVIQRLVPLDGKVLDGFSGYAALRPHAYYFWWINEYSLALLTPTQREADLLEALERAPPAAVLFDEHLALLPRPVTDWINAHYAPMNGEEWVWFPRDGSGR